MKILVTGFEPFGKLPLNSSWEVVNSLPEVVDGNEIHKKELPVVFGEAADIAYRYALGMNADAVLLVGQAEGYTKIAVEKAALNIRDAAIADNKGSRPIDEPVCVNGENALFSTSDVKKIAQRINEKGVPCRVSYSAGTYVCNDIFYTMLHNFKGTNVKVGFIHLPEIGNKADISPEDMKNALTEAIRIICEDKRGNPSLNS